MSIISIPQSNILLWTTFLFMLQFYLLLLSRFTVSVSVWKTCVFLWERTRMQTLMELLRVTKRNLWDESYRYTFAKVEGYLTALRLITAKDQFTFIREILYLLHQICHKQSSLRKLLIAFIIFYTNACLVISSLLL